MTEPHVLLVLTKEMRLISLLGFLMGLLLLKMMMIRTPVLVCALNTAIYLVIVLALLLLGKLQEMISREL